MQSEKKKRLVYMQFYAFFVKRAVNINHIGFETGTHLK